ncbi:NAD dependent epimerase dehydratase family domain containing protein [Musa troglodytarum]|uniref:UDP-glucuronic acid decarboxylase 1 n=1 Tax=Musa troglodytarum TaxID=320322 RepID=A0A9E7KB73_9LILI|nr:NAD dependent epimerase dehydratase family domain containing protein [Musa troglodytarum]
MKQLHKQSSLNQNQQIPTYAAKPAKPQARPSSASSSPSFLRAAAGYLLREQRLLFVLAGAVIASTFFLLHPYYHSSTSGLQPSDHLAHRLLPTFRHPSSASSFGGGDATIGGSGKRVPVGLKKPSKRVVVTGGAGFVGSHLVDKLLARGDSVIVIDNFFTGRKENVVHHFGNPRFELIRHDVVEPILLEVDEIYHLACPASPVHYNKDDSFCFIDCFKFLTIEYKTNVMGTLNMLGLAKRIGARFLLTSTSEVYGDPLEHPQKETYWGHVNPIGVRSCYDEGKRTAETLTMDYHRGAEVEVRIARIFNTYGPRMCLDDGRVVSNFVAQALRKEPMTVYGDGKQTRSFQYVSDLVLNHVLVPFIFTIDLIYPFIFELPERTSDDRYMKICQVDGLVALMEGEHMGPFNLGNPGEFTMLELAEVVKEVVDPSATIEFRPNTADDPHMRKPDISKAKEQLNWEPKVTLREGLPRMVTDFSKRILSAEK